MSGVSKNVVFSIAVGLAVLLIWYLLDGRYTYIQDGGTTRRIDRLTGERCVRTYNNYTGFICP